MSLRFKEKRVIVTGAAAGIGRATALLFASEGARVMAFDREDLSETVRSSSGVMESLQGDAGSEPDVRGLVNHAVDRFGGVDIIVANAGVLGGMAGLLEQDVDAFAETLRINLIGPFLTLKHGAPLMMANGGAVVCTASIAGMRSGAGGIAYSSSKAGVLNLVQLAAQQLSGTGIRVNAVCPGLIETGMTHSLFDRARSAGREGAIGQLNPLRRAGSAEEIASAIAFLASDEASYINGHALVVDGGLSSSHPVARPPEVGKSSL